MLREKKMIMKVSKKNIAEQHAEKKEEGFLSEDFIGRSSAFNSITDSIKMVAGYNCPVVISGETGTGKEIVAHKIHSNSARNNSIFVPVDCTTMTSQLFESQLFGHVKGSFTGAISDSLGFFRAADGGTIFLDEIGELSLELQPKLLRVLQDSYVVPVGSTQPCKVDVRVICATNRDLQQMVRNGNFRADLFYRLDVIHLEIPPLRSRSEDIIPLAEHFLDRQASLYDRGRKKLTDQAAQLLQRYKWPGNVRELANVMERAYILSSSDDIVPVTPQVKIMTEDVLSGDDQHFPTLDEVNKRLVTRALQTSNGRIMETAKLLKIGYGKLHRLINKYNLSSTYKQ